MTSLSVFLMILSAVAAETTLQKSCVGPNVIYHKRFCYQFMGIRANYQNALKFDCQLGSFTGFLWMPTTLSLTDYIINVTTNGGTLSPYTWMALRGINQTHYVWERWVKGRLQLSQPFGKLGSPSGMIDLHHYPISIKPPTSSIRYTVRGQHEPQFVFCQFEDPEVRHKFVLQSRGMRLPLLAVIGEKQNEGSPAGCSIHCMMTPVCRAFSVSKNKQTCLIFGTKPDENPNVSLENDDDYETYYIED